MATNIPLTGTFNVTCVYGKPGSWACGRHTGIDLTGSDIIYATCDGVVYKTGVDKSYGNYVTVRANDGKYHWYCHLSKIYVKAGQAVSRVTKIGLMGNTGRSTGKHLHFEIRNESNRYSDDINPATYMGIPNLIGKYDSNNYKIQKEQDTNILKTLARNTNLRTQPTTKSGGTLYLANTTLYVTQQNAAIAEGYTWDKVKIRQTGAEGYMINKNYK